MPNGIVLKATGETAGLIPCREGEVQIMAALADRPATPVSWTLPVADAARPARPDLYPRIERLRIERIAVAARTERGRGPRRAVSSRPDARLSRLRNGTLGNSFRVRGRRRRRAFGGSLGQGPDDRCELGGRPERPRRQHGLRQVEAQKFVRLVFVRLVFLGLIFVALSNLGPRLPGRPTPASRRW